MCDHAEDVLRDHKHVGSFFLVSSVASVMHSRIPALNEVGVEQYKVP